MYCSRSSNIVRQIESIKGSNTLSIYLGDLFEHSGAYVKDTAAYGTALGKELPLLQRGGIVPDALIHSDSSYDK